MGDVLVMVAVGALCWLGGSLLGAWFFFGRH
jgi:hypothetical protein